MMKRLHRIIEQRTGWLFGTYRSVRRDDPGWPFLAAGHTVAASGLESYPSGIYVTLGEHGVYVSRTDALERGRARQIGRLEEYANQGTTAGAPR
jgi:hypothetical protein